MNTYSLPIENVDTLIQLINSDKTPDEIHTAPNISVLWFRLSELDELDKEEHEDFITLREILSNKNICIIAMKSDYFSLAYNIEKEFYTVKKRDDKFLLTDLCDNEIIVEEREIYVSPLRIKDFQIDDIMGN